MTFAGVKDIVLFAIALYGAGLSTWNLVSAFKRDRRAVRVTAGTKTPVYENGQLANAWAHLEVTNIGQRPVTITMIAFEVDGGRRLFSMQRNGRFPGLEDTPLPATLSDGQTARFHQAYIDIGQALMADGKNKKCVITPICEDSAGGIHRGKPWEVHWHELMNM